MGALPLYGRSAIEVSCGGSCSGLSRISLTNNRVSGHLELGRFIGIVSLTISRGNRYKPNNGTTQLLLQRHRTAFES